MKLAILTQTVRPRTATGAGLLVMLAAAGASPAYCSEAPAVGAQGNAPGWITINYRHSGTGGAVSFLLEADKRGIVQAQSIPNGQFFDTSLTPNSEHSYRVCALYDDNDVACSGWQKARTLPPPAAPPNFEPPTITNFVATPTVIRITWGPTGNYTRILIRWGEVGHGAAQPEIPNVSNGQYRFGDLEPGHTYSFGLKGCSPQVFAKSTCGEWSPPVLITTPVPELPWSKPVLTITENSATRVVLQFSANAVKSLGRDKFVVYRDTTPIQQLKPEGNANPGPRTGSFTDVVSTRPDYNVCITEEGWPRASICSDTVRRPQLPAGERGITQEASRGKGCVELAAGCPPAVAPHRDTCKSGFVWRNAFDGDTVCVIPEIRDQAAADNAQGPNRRAPNGSNTCKSGFVWREARVGDDVCVTPQTREQAGIDNRHANERRLVPRYPGLYKVRH